jgi:cathepsin A (carboxypeptidase C)
MAQKAVDDDMFLGESQKSGLVNMTNGDDMFYWLFNSRNEPSTDPLVMWLTGGPGCSSELAIFYENGPFSINDDLSLKVNQYSWNNVSNVLFVDNPIGTGFSKCSGISHYDTNEDEVAEGID